MKRREFLHQGALIAGGLAVAPRALKQRPSIPKPLFEISLAGWSLHRRHFQEKKMGVLDFPKVAREEFGIGAIELVNTMMDVPHARNLQALRERAKEHDVKILLIMCDAEGNLSAADESARRQAVHNHHKWVDIAKRLGCHSIRVNTGGKANVEADIQRCARSLRELADYSKEQQVSILVENHGGLSSHPASLTQVMRLANSPWVGTLPDFGNFPADTDRYEAIAAMMPYAKAVSAKCHDFDDAGQETKTDFARMMQVVLDAGYRGYVGIEYEGGRMSEHDGILAAFHLLQALQKKTAQSS